MAIVCKITNNDCLERAPKSNILESTMELFHTKGTQLGNQGALCVELTPDGCTPVASQVYAKFKHWYTPEMQKSTEPCVKICMLVCQYTKDIV